MSQVMFNFVQSETLALAVKAIEDGAEAVSYKGKGASAKHTAQIAQALVGKLDYVG